MPWRHDSVGRLTQQEIHQPNAQTEHRGNESQQFTNNRRSDSSSTQDYVIQHKQRVLGNLGRMQQQGKSTPSVITRGVSVPLSSPGNDLHAHAS